MTIQLESIRDKVRSILERANHPNTPQAEADTALTLAYRLMQKYNLADSDIEQRATCDRFNNEIEIMNFFIAGPYRVRRASLFHVIAGAVCCASYREAIAEPHEIVMVAFGTPRDLNSLEVLFTAADILALRTMPSGDRQFRTSWWHGFSAGVNKNLAKERRNFFTESPGAELALIERYDRAEEKMNLTVPGLRFGSSFVNDEHAYGVGHRAGLRFTTGDNAIGSWQRSLNR